VEVGVKHKSRIVFAGVLALLLAAGSLSAHHAFASLFDVQKVNKLKGIVKLVVWANPHSLIFMDTMDANGQVEHYAIEGPSTLQMHALGLDQRTIMAGDTLEVCGYGTKDGVDPLRSFAPPEPISLSLKSIPRETSTGRLISPATMSLNGRKIIANTQETCSSSTNVR